MCSVDTQVTSPTSVGCINCTPVQLPIKTSQFRMSEKKEHIGAELLIRDLLFCTDIGQVNEWIGRAREMVARLKKAQGECDDTINTHSVRIEEIDKELASMSLWQMLVTDRINYSRLFREKQDLLSKKDETLSQSCELMLSRDSLEEEIRRMPHSLSDAKRFLIKLKEETAELKKSKKHLALSFRETRLKVKRETNEVRSREYYDHARKRSAIEKVKQSWNHEVQSFEARIIHTEREILSKGERIKWLTSIVRAKQKVE